jgi:hypothetical protein
MDVTWQRKGVAPLSLLVTFKKNGIVDSQDDFGEIHEKKTNHLIGK